MIRLFFILFCASVFSSSQSQVEQCKYIIGPPKSGSVTTILNPASLPGIGPGDVICLEAGTFYQILVDGLQGECGQPITIRNHNGRVIVENDAHYGISVRNSSYLTITGNGDNDILYGLAIMRVERGAGLCFGSLSSNVTASYLEIGNTALSGIIAKTDPNISLTSLRNQFTMYDTHIHDNYIYNTGMEGIYIGSSFYNGMTIHYNEKDTLVYPHVNVGVQVYNNKVENTGRNGIQVSSAVSGCLVRDNHVLYDSQSQTNNHMSGINIGGGSVCDIYNNHIAFGKGSGIEIFGRGNMKVFNNLIEYPGSSIQSDEMYFVSFKHGIYVQDINTDPDAPVHLFNNTIISPNGDGIRFVNDKTTGSRIQNNIIIDPGSYRQIGDLAYINHPGLPLMVSHNLLALNLQHAGFKDPDNGDYYLKSGSPAVNTGINLSSYGITFDRLYNPRPNRGSFDIGAHELDSWESEDEIPILKVYPNPFSQFLSVQFSLIEKSDVRLQLNDLSGKTVFIHDERQLGPGVHEINIQPMLLSSQEMHVLTLITTDRSVSIFVLYLK